MTNTHDCQSLYFLWMKNRRLSIFDCRGILRSSKTFLKCVYEQNALENQSKEMVSLALTTKENKIRVKITVKDIGVWVLSDILFFCQINSRKVNVLFAKVFQVEISTIVRFSVLIFYKCHIFHRNFPLNFFQCSILSWLTDDIMIVWFIQQKCASVLCFASCPASIHGKLWTSPVCDA